MLWQGQVVDQKNCVAQVDTDMPVLAITTFQTSSAQLIAEYLPEHQHKAAQTSVATRLARLTGRLKSKDNYTGKAGMNLYEDVSGRRKICSRMLI